MAKGRGKLSANDDCWKLGPCMGGCMVNHKCREYELCKDFHVTLRSIKAAVWRFHSWHWASIKRSGMPPCFDTAGCDSVYLSTPVCYSVFPAEVMFLAVFFFFPSVSKGNFSWVFQQWELFSWLIYSLCSAVGLLLFFFLSVCCWVAWITQFYDPVKISLLCVSSFLLPCFPTFNSP